MGVAGLWMSNYSNPHREGERPSEPRIVAELGRQQWEIDAAEG